MIERAKKAREYSYSPYSNFKVGACLETASGKYYEGCNVENGSYGATNCAERTAFYKAISEGEREFTRIAIVGGKEELEDYCFPCGICLQVMNEFCDKNTFEILVGKSNSDYKTFKLKELLPAGFDFEQ